MPRQAISHYYIITCWQLWINQSWGNRKALEAYQLHQTQCTYTASLETPQPENAVLPLKRNRSTQISAEWFLPHTSQSSTYLWVIRVIPWILQEDRPSLLRNVSQQHTSQDYQTIIDGPLSIITRPFIYTHKTHKSTLTVKQHNN